MRIAAAVIAIVSTALAQGIEKTAPNLVEFLSRPDSIVQEMGLEGGCPNQSDDRAAAISLARLGEPAIPQIENGLKSMERADFISSHTAWLLYAYAKIKGTEAYPMISRMRRDRRFASLEPAWDRVTALSLSLTSYISDSHASPALRMVNGSVHFCRPQEPRDALDQLIHSWMNNDRALMEASLGPHARAALDSVMKLKTWEEWRSIQGISKHRSGESMGYSFEAAGRWAEPEESLTTAIAGGQTLLDFDEFDLETRLADGVGKECGRYQIRFMRSRNGPSGSLGFFVDTMDMDGILALVSNCIAKGAPQPND